MAARKLRGRRAIGGEDRQCEFYGNPVCGISPARAIPAVETIKRLSRGGP
jgi:hypothetical protein